MTLTDEIVRYAKKVGYVPREVTVQICDCGCDLFTLISDDDEGGAFATCRQCASERDIQSSRNYIETPVRNVCTCDGEFLELAVGVAYHADSDDARWIYVGGQCPDCELAGVSVDWHERQFLTGCFWPQAVGRAICCKLTATDPKRTLGLAP